jgi:DNA ligase-1
VLRKDLQAGVNIDTAIKAGFDIPKFEVMLAKDGKKCKKLDSILKKGCSVSPKLDGYRCLAIVENGSVSLHTRNGDMYQNFPVIEEALKSACNGGNYVFDGEIMSDNFNKMQQSAFASTRGTTVGDVRYHIFDMIPNVEWITDDFKTPAFDRYKTLAEWFKGVTTDRLVPVEREIAYSLSAVLTAERKYINAGYEGAMVNPNIPYYKGKKSNKMLKFKTMLSMDCEIIGFYEGTKRLEGTLGGLIVKQENEVKCEVGTGFSDADRIYIWENQAKFLGRVVEIQYQDLTEKEQRMRFPSAIRWRIDKD